MKYPTVLLALAVSLGASVACGGDDGDTTGPSTSYENIAGTYSGIVVGISQGITLDAIFSLTLTQSRGTLGGSYGLTGTLSDGVETVGIQGTGTITGTIAAGENPSVNVTARSGTCPNVQSPFSGVYDSANRRITVNGSVRIVNASCQVVLTYTGTIILAR